MPASFDIQASLREQPVPFRDPRQVKAFLTEVTGYQGAVKTLDEGLTIKSQASARFGSTAAGFVLQTLKSGIGDRFSLDQDLIAAAGSDFYSVSDRMELIVPPDRIDRVLEVLMQEQNYALAAFDFKDQAREFLGVKLPELQVIAAVAKVEESAPLDPLTPSVESTLASDPITTASISTPLGNLTVQVFASTDDYLRLEFAGSTANWMEYPSQNRIEHIARADIAEMEGMSILSAYAEFAVQQVHMDFVQHLEQEATRITPTLRRWLQQNEAGDQEATAGFLEHYPERDRIGLTSQFMQFSYPDGDATGRRAGVNSI